MSFRFPQPANEDDFELFCLRLLRHLWRCPSLQQYGKRGQRQSGIDLIDVGGGTPFRAVQCKHHEPQMKLPRGEVTDEVSSALAYTPPLDEYYILTTAQRSTHNQNAVIAANRSNTAAGRFKVLLWTWDVIENELAQLDDTTFDFVLRGDSGRGLTAIARTVKDVLADHLDRDLYASATVFDTELDAVKAAIEGHRLEVADDHLNRLEARGADRLQDRHRYQIKAFRAQLGVRRGEWAAAGRELLDAKRLQPTTERARINEALGLELTGDRAGAHALAGTLLAEFRNAARLVAVWVRTAPPSTPLAETEAAAAPFLTDNEELNLALAHRALAADDTVAAETYARRTTALAPDSPHGWYLLGQALHGRGHRAGKKDRDTLLAAARESYESAARLAQAQKWTDLAASARFHLGSVRWLLGDIRAEAEYLSAVSADAAGGRHRVDYAAYLLGCNRYPDALAELARVPEEPDGRRLVLEAAARYGRNAAGDRDAARAALVRLAAGGSADGWEDAHALLVTWAAEDGDWAAADAALSGPGLRTCAPVFYHALRAWAAVARENTAAAQDDLAAASAAVGPDTDRQQLFLLAQVYALAGDDGAALPLFERCYRPGLFNAECRKLLDCARRLARHDVTVRVCRELRLAGESDKRLVETEVGLLQRYDPAAALAVAAEYRTAHPDDRHAALWQSWLAVRLDRPELIISDVNRLPRADETTVQGTGLVLAVLRDTGQPEAGLRYAYAALREHSGDEAAHGQYTAYFLRWCGAVPHLRVAGTAGPGMAVRYREEHADADRWVVVEDESAPDPGLAEVGPDHHLARAFAGRAVGAVVTLAPAGLQPRTATVADVIHKHLYRFRDCMDQFQVRFPDSITGIQVVRCGTGDAFDPTPLIRGLEGRQNRIRELDDHYRKEPLPLTMFASAAGRNEFETWGHLTADPTLGIRCATGQPQEIAEALQHFRAATTVVLDLTALITLADLDLLSVVRGRTKAWVVSPGTLDRLHDLYDEAAEEERETGCLFLADDGRPTIVESTADRRAAFVTLLRSILDAVRENAEVRPCPQLAALDPRKRDGMTEAVGHHTLEAMGLAEAADAVLWTDDLMIGCVARAEFGARRVWTQAVLHELFYARELPEADYHRGTAGMVGHHYASLQVNDSTLVAAAELAGWDMTRWPAPQVMRTLGQDAADPATRVLAAAQAIRTVWWRDLTTFQRQGFLFAVLGGLGSVRLITFLRRRALPALFSMDVIHLGEVIGLTRAWLDNPTQILRP